MEERLIYCGGKKLRCGYTTGSCAAAASRAAAQALLTRQTVRTADIATPKGEHITLCIARCELSDKSVLCSVVKDSGGASGTGRAGGLRDRRRRQRDPCIPQLTAAGDSICRRSDT